MRFQYNRVLNLRDYVDLAPAGRPFTGRKQWETEMGYRTLADHGAIHADARILGVGAGRERLIYMLSTQVREVVPTDLYRDYASRWYQAGWFDDSFLTNPSAHAHVFAADIPHDASRIHPLHMDGRKLEFADNTFDGIFSSGSIEHFGEQALFPQWDAVHAAAAEIGRVLKPGGIASISTEYRLEGEGWGFDHNRLFSASDLWAHIVIQSGLKLVDPIRTRVDWETLRARYHIHDFGTERMAAVECVITYAEYAFTSVHLALRKPL